MKQWLLSEFRAKLNRDLDLTEETFITAEELTGYINEAIDEAEAEVHTLYEDYFLSKTTINLVANQADYSLPTDIYANKIRAIVYNNGTDIYPLKRLRGKDEFEEASLINFYQNTTNYYRYIITNTAASGFKITLFPAARETLSGALTVWYIRNAAELVDETDACDIPEATNFILQYVKVRCYEKDPGHPNTQKAIQDLEMQRERLINSLSNRVDDMDTTIPIDSTFYRDFDDCNIY